MYSFNTLCEVRLHDIYLYIGLKKTGDKYYSILKYIVILNKCNSYCQKFLNI